MKKVKDNKFAKYLFSIYAKSQNNLIFKGGNVYRVYTGGQQAETKLIATLVLNP